MIRRKVEKYTKKFITAKRMARWYYSRTGYYDWAKLLRNETQWKNVCEKAKEGPKILVATSIGFHLPSVTMESLLAVALTLRGANVHVLLCDIALPACSACEVGWHSDQVRFAREGQSKFFCRYCYNPAHEMYRSLGLTVYGYREFLNDGDFENALRISLAVPTDEIENYRLDDCAVGEHALAGALRFFARGTIEEEPFADDILRLYFRASLLSVFAMRNLMKKENYQAAVFNHGIYVPQGLVNEVCRREQVRVVTWNPAYKKKCFIYSHDNSYHHTMINEPAEKWMNISWNAHLEKELSDYLRSRWKGSEDWIFFHDKPNFEVQKIVQELGIDLSKPCIGMLTSVVWDAVLHYPSNAFPNMLEWVIETIRYFIERQDLQLIIRVHPAEIHGALPSRQRVVDEVRKIFPALPQNIIIIPPESTVSTYAVMHFCDSVIIYNTKTGVELCAGGIPVIVAGEAWIRNKGFTVDVENAADYFKILDRLPFKKRMSAEDTETAKKYAYHFFFRRMIPLEFMEPSRGWPPFRINLSSIDELRSGASKGLDVICNGILEGTDFIYPAEEETGKMKVLNDRRSPEKRPDVRE